MSFLKKLPIFLAASCFTVLSWGAGNFVTGFLGIFNPAFQGTLSGPTGKFVTPGGVGIIAESAVGSSSFGALYTTDLTPNTGNYLLVAASGVTILRSSIDMYMQAGGLQLEHISNTGVRMGLVSTAAATAYLNFDAGTATAGSAPIKFTAGVVTTTPVSGQMETDASNNLYYTPASSRFPVALDLSGTSGSIGGGLLAAGACATGTVTITGATTSMVAIASPAAGVDPSNGGVLGVAIDARVSSANTVTVSVCSPIAGTPTAATYAVRVFQ